MVDEIAEASLEQRLKQSYEQFGPIRKVIRTNFGIAAGNTRKKAVKDWPEEQKDVETYYDHLKLAAHDNVQEQKGPEWWKNLLLEASKELSLMNTPPEKICTKLAEDFPISARYIRELLPAEYKEITRKNLTPVNAEQVPHTLDTAEDIIKEMIHLRDSGRWCGHLLRPLIDKVKFIKTFENIDKAISDGQPLTEVLKILETNVGYAPAKSDQTKKGAYTDPQLTLGAELQRRRIPVEYEVEYPIPNRKTVDGKPISYKVDILADKTLAVEVEGNGSSSSNNPERDQFLKKQGLQILHVPNEDALKQPSMMVDKIQSLLNPPQPNVEENPTQEQPSYTCPSCGADITTYVKNESG